VDGLIELFVVVWIEDGDFDTQPRDVGGGAAAVGRFVSHDQLLSTAAEIQTNQRGLDGRKLERSLVIHSPSCYSTHTRRTSVRIYQEPFLLTKRLLAG
jgi:hypothetical protein